MRPGGAGGGGGGGGWGSSQDLAAAPWEPTTWGHSEEEQLPASWIDTRRTLGGHLVARHQRLPRDSQGVLLLVLLLQQGFTAAAVGAGQFPRTTF